MQFIWRMQSDWRLIMALILLLGDVVACIILLPTGLTVLAGSHASGAACVVLMVGRRDRWVMAASVAWATLAVVVTAYAIGH